MVVVLVEAAVQGYTVRVDEEVLQGRHSLKAQRALHAIRQVGVIKNHTKAEGLGPKSHSLTYSPWKMRNCRNMNNNLECETVSVLCLGINTKQVQQPPVSVV